MTNMNLSLMDELGIRILGRRLTRRRSDRSAFIRLCLGQGPFVLLLLPPWFTRLEQHQRGEESMSEESNSTPSAFNSGAKRQFPGCLCPWEPDVVTEHSVFLLYKLVCLGLQPHKLLFQSLLLGYWHPSKERATLKPQHLPSPEWEHCVSTQPTPLWDGISTAGSWANPRGFMGFALPLMLAFWNVQENRRHVKLFSNVLQWLKVCTTNLCGGDSGENTECLLTEGNQGNEAFRKGLSQTWGICTSPLAPNLDKSSGAQLGYRGRGGR